MLEKREKSLRISPLPLWGLGCVILQSEMLRLLSQIFRCCWCCHTVKLILRFPWRRILQIHKWHCNETNDCSKQNAFSPSTLLLSYLQETNLKSNKIVNLQEAVVAEWLRRLTRNQLGYARAGSNPADCERFWFLNVYLIGSLT